MRDMSGTIRRLGGNLSYTVTRYKARGTTDGEVDPLRVDSTFDIKASIQPASGNDLQRLPEGMRTSDVVVIFTSTLLRVLGQDAADQLPPDTIVYNGSTYQIETVQDWIKDANYCEALARKVSQ